MMNDDIRKEPILIRDGVIVNLARDSKADLCSEILAVDLMKKRISNKSIPKGKNLDDFFSEFRNDGQARAIISLLQDNGLLTKVENDIIIPGGAYQ